MAIESPAVATTSTHFQKEIYAAVPAFKAGN